MPDQRPFGFASFWETWGDLDDPDSLYRSCTIITTDAAESIKDIHHRMPVVLKPNPFRPGKAPFSGKSIAREPAFNVESVHRA